jgi:hypothetical protein
MEHHGGRRAEVGFDSSSSRFMVYGKAQGQGGGG